ncbi:MAG TPA: cupredoxin domain-containing protein [Myxococcota bacterium]|nr:cupredoxin domain-containing protein [Myxococcota bacterium]
MRALAALGLAALAACSRAYAPQTRAVTLTAVPLVTHELESVYPFLKQDFAPGGVLEGKEIYAFVPDTVTVYAGDTVDFTLVNPEDDEHKFVLEDLVVDLPGQSVQHATWRALRPGVYPFQCVMPAHIPYMHGQLVVLPAELGAGAG